MLFGGKLYAARAHSAVSSTLHFMYVARSTVLYLITMACGACCGCRSSGPCLCALQQPTPQ